MLPGSLYLEGSSLRPWGSSRRLLSTPLRHPPYFIYSRPFQVFPSSRAAPGCWLWSCLVPCFFHTLWLFGHCLIPPAGYTVLVSRPRVTCHCGWHPPSHSDLCVRITSAYTQCGLDGSMSRVSLIGLEANACLVEESSL